MAEASSLEQTPCANARGRSASRRGLTSRAKSALSAAVAMGIMGLTTGCQSESPSASTNTGTSQIQSTSPIQSQGPSPTASQIQSQTPGPTPSQSQSQSPTQNQSPTQSQSPSPIESLTPSASSSPIQSLIPSPSASAPPRLDAPSALALGVRVNPDAAQPIISSETSDPGIDLTSPNDLPPEKVAGAPATQAVPGPLPIFGAAAAFGSSRQLKKRIKESTASTNPESLGGLLPILR